ncbi:hypothetical protein BB561_004347 [Smittium simulii]|uniref:Uncharacterized protein n=1 Tax=Smittium simulii TaxID=133385 RepID=A0A2T9YGW2_9FUNG|nr:hypothetical protein BB561_004347 [Smittium simulii]
MLPATQPTISFVGLLSRFTGNNQDLNQAKPGLRIWVEGPAEKWHSDLEDTESKFEVSLSVHWT